MAVDKKFINVLLLGLGFMFVFTAFQTMGNIEKIILDSIPSFDGDAYISLAIIYATFAICNWFAPSFITISGPRCAIFIGAITYLIYISSFLMPRAWLLYTTSAIMGFGAAIIWTGQGNYLTLNSTKETMSRNSGVFWALLQASMFFGNLFVFFQFHGKSDIDADTRKVVIYALIGVAILGILFILLLRPTPRSNDEELGEQKGPLLALKESIKLFKTYDMRLLSLTFFYTGLELSFYSAVYGACIGFTLELGENGNQLAALSGILVGAGEVIGGAIFGIFSAKTNKWGRDPIVIAGYIIHTIAFFLIFLNFPNNAPIGKTTDVGFISPSPILAILGSFLLGFGDSCFNTQIFSILGGLFSDNSAEAFALFKFTQSVAAAVALAYSTVFQLYYQLLILIIMGTIGTVAFVRVEIMNRRKSTDMIKSENSETI